MPSYHHIKKLQINFGQKSRKNRQVTFYPSAKNHRELNLGTSGVTFRDESAGNTQKFTAPPNRHFTCFVMTFEIFKNFVCSNFFSRFFFFRMHPNISECIRMSENKSERARKREKTARKRRKTSQKRRGRWHGVAVKSAVIRLRMYRRVRSRELKSILDPG